MERTANLGRLRKVGECFETTSNQMTRREFWARKGWREHGRYKLYKKGDKDYFTKGKRRYYCEVMGITKTLTGVHCFVNLGIPGMQPGNRWWQFTYLVKILEN